MAVRLDLAKSRRTQMSCVSPNLQIGSCPQGTASLGTLRCPLGARGKATNGPGIQLGLRYAADDGNGPDGTRTITCPGTVKD
jgi:hypothetical protein